MRCAQFTTIAMAGCLWLAFAVSANAASVTATGCLAKGDKQGEFTLSHATGGGAQQYELVGTKGVDLNAHVGHKVEITGETAAQPNEKSSVKTEEKDKPHQHLEVKSLRHVAAQCP